jgi:hypothetical protein
VIRLLWAEGVPRAEINSRLSAQYGNNALPRRRANTRVCNGNIRHRRVKKSRTQSSVGKVMLTDSGIHKAQLWITMKRRRTRGSSVSIVSRYGLDDRTIEVRSSAEAKDFSSSLCAQTSSRAHPASCTMGTGGHFPGAKVRPRRDDDHSPSSAGVENE